MNTAKGCGNIAHGARLAKYEPADVEQEKPAKKAAAKKPAAKKAAAKKTASKKATPAKQDVE